MASNSLFRNVIEIGFGLMFLMGGIADSLYTLRHGNEVFGPIAEGAMLASAKHLIQTVVIPHATLFTILLIVFKLSVAFCILSRGALVRPGLIAGAIFTFVFVPVASISWAIFHLVASAVQAYLALIR